MKIILNEIKKIFNFKMVALLMLGSYIIYSMFISFHVETFPNGRPQLDDYNISVQMIKDYGQEMDESELEDLKKINENKLNEADEFLKNSDEFNEFGIYSYNDYLCAQERSMIVEEEMNEEYEKLCWINLKSNEGTIFWELQVFESIMGQYECRDNYFEDNSYNEQRGDRINEIIENNENESILPYFIYENYNNLIKNTALCIITGIVFMLTPIFVRDKKNKVEYLQYSSKRGRKIYISKLIAGFISALVITTVEIITMFILYKPDKVSMFFNSNINSVYNNRFWFSMTFIQFIIVTVVFVYVISIAAAFICMFVASKGNSYVSVIGMQVPVLLGIIKLTENIMLDNLFILYKSKYLALSVGVILVLTAILLTIVSCRREKLIREI